MREALKDIEKSYDYIIVDCAPSLSLITVNALAAVQGVVIPMQCEYYALEDWQISRRQLTVFSRRLILTCIVGVLRTMYDARNALTRDVSAELEQYFGKTLRDGYST